MKHFSYICKSFCILAPDKIRQFGYQGTPTSVTVYWSPPLKPNGVIESYVVKHYPLPSEQTNTQGGLYELTEAYMNPVPHPGVYNVCVILEDLNTSYSLLLDDILQDIVRNRDSISESKYSEFVFNVTSLHLSSNNVTEEHFNTSLHTISMAFSQLDVNELNWILTWSKPVLELCADLLWVRNGKSTPFIHRETKHLFFCKSGIKMDLLM